MVLPQERKEQIYRKGHRWHEGDCCLESRNGGRTMKETCFQNIRAVVMAQGIEKTYQIRVFLCSSNFNILLLAFQKALCYIPSC